MLLGGRLARGGGGGGEGGGGEARHGGGGHLDRMFVVNNNVKGGGHASSGENIEIILSIGANRSSTHWCSAAFTQGSVLEQLL